jgi:hypothetical protein
MALDGETPTNRIGSDFFLIERSFAVNMFCGLRITDAKRLCYLHDFSW